MKKKLITWHKRQYRILLIITLILVYLIDNIQLNNTNKWEYMENQSQSNLIEDE